MALKGEKQNYEAILLKEFNQRFSDSKLRAALEDALEYGLAVMQDNTPVAKGTLITSEDINIISPMKGELIASAEHAVYVNGGTSRMPPQPFFDRGTLAAKQRYADNMWKL